MTLQLDARQRAMLEEMGVRLFWPDAPIGLEMVEAAAPIPAAGAPAVAARRAEPAPAHVPAAAVAGPPAVAPRVELGELASLDWPALEQAVTQWAAERHRKAVFGAGDLHAGWLCVGEPPLEEEETQGVPFAGDPGRLLDNMLAAVGASRRQGAYLTNVLKCRLPEDRAGEAQELAQSLAFLRRQVELLRPKVLLAMGRFAVQALLQTGEPVGKLRGRVHRWGEVPVVVTYHPAYLLRTPADKARAWADLCLARSLVAEAN